MEILNIDAFAQPKRFMVLAGQRHEVKPLTVQDFIDNLKAATELEKQGAADLPLHEQVDASVREIVKAVPTLDEAVVRGLSIEAVTAIMKFIRGDLDPTEAAPGAQGDADAKKPS